MNPSFFKKIRCNYDRLIPEAEGMLARDNPITFPNRNHDICVELSRLYSQIEIGLSKLIPDSEEKHKYKYMLIKIKQCIDGISDLNKKFFDPRV